MKKLILSSICFLLVAFVCAQSPQQKAPYLRFPTIPPFTLLKTDSSSITRDNLPKKKKTMIMYFSPTCDHCQVQTDSMVAQMNKLKDVEILMVSYSSLREMKTFYENRQLNRYKNIQMGYDTKYFFQPFYKIRNLPYMALYSKKGTYITSFEGNAGIDKIVEAFNRE